MPRISVGHYEQDAGDIYLPLGYIPDYVMLCDFHTSTNIIFYHWWKEMESHEAAAAQEGISVAEGVTARMADDAGIAEYDTGSEKDVDVPEWAASTAFTARTATAEGTLVRPTLAANPELFEAVFECVDGGTTGSTEPTWPAAIGDQVVDNDGTWERVNVAMKRKGYQGILVADNIQTNGQEMYYLAMLADRVDDWGDVDAWPSGIYDG